LNSRKMAVSEEKVSSDLENSFTKEKIVDEGASNDIKSDAMLDEIAAKTDSLDFSRLQPDEDGDFHKTTLETVKNQKETINTLVQQLRLMFDNYRVVEEEKCYYENLSEALIKCLALEEGKLEVESEESEKECEQEEDITNLISNKTAQLHISEQETSKEIKVTQNTSEESSEKDEQKTNVLKGEEEKNDSLNEVQTIPKNDLIRINRTLLHEIFELRHQMDVMKENIREYLATDTEAEGSEYDTATDDDHICEHCAPQKQQTEQNENTNEEEEYEILENEEDQKIKDDPDTE